MLKTFDVGAAKCGIYAIYIQDKIVYIGQSGALTTRMREHEKGIKSGKGNAPWYPVAHQFYIRNFDISCKVIAQTTQSELLPLEEKYIRTYQPIFNERINYKETKPVPKTYEEAISLLNLTSRDPVKLEQIENEERAQHNGWFGEQYAKKEEFFWWEYE